MPYHQPVLLNDCLDGLNIKPDGVYVDVTFGGGGHSKAILEKLGANGKLFAFDQDKYAAKNVYLFIGLVPDRVRFYEYLQECGYILIFKQTITVAGRIKGNCDAELVLKVVSDFYTKQYDKSVLITGDGDFGCLVEFLKDNSVLAAVIAPDKYKCSILIKNKNIEITFLNEHYHKFKLN